MDAPDELPEAVELYFHHLGSDDYAEAANQFAEDAVYLHPPNFQEEATITGRDAIESFFRESRGSKSVSHAIRKVVRSGDRCGLVGHATGEDIDGEDYFVSFAELDNGKISYYIAGLLQGNV